MHALAAVADDGGIVRRRGSFDVIVRFVPKG